MSVSTTGMRSASPASRSASGTLISPPWLVDATPARDSSWSRVMVISRVAGVPPLSGSSPPRSALRPMSSNASWRRCPAVRRSGSPSAAGTGADNASSQAWVTAVQPGVR